MKGRRSFEHCRIQHTGAWRVLLPAALMIAAACFAEQQQTAPRRRTPRAARLKTIQLPEPVTDSPVSFEKALAGQQKVELPSDRRLRFSEIGQLAWAAQGVAVPEIEGGQVQNLQFPIKVYLSLPDGLYLYNPVSHALEQTSDREARQDLARALLNPPATLTGGCQIIIAGSARDFTARYGARARTALLLQTGQMAQSIQLQAVALGLTFISIDNIDSAAVRRTTRFPRSLEPLYVAFVGYPVSAVPEPTFEQPTREAGRKVVIVAAQQGFQDVELFEAKRALELASVQTLVASVRSGPMAGELGGTLVADLALRQVNVSEFDGLIFVGGRGAVDYYSNTSVLNLARQAATQRKVLAASGIAPSILANAGVLRGVQATAFLSERARLMQAGAAYTGQPTEKDGLIVTSTGPLAVAEFVNAILQGLGEAG